MDPDTLARDCDDCRRLRARLYQVASPLPGLQADAPPEIRQVYAAWIRAQVEKDHSRPEYQAAAEALREHKKICKGDNKNGHV